ncbi:hypothetical protein RFI_09863, partial [Reticulomyxa filosa]
THKIVFNEKALLIRKYNLINCFLGTTFYILTVWKLLNLIFFLVILIYIFQTSKYFKRFAIQRMTWKASITIDSKTYEVTLAMLTIENLKEQMIEISEINKKENMAIEKIINSTGQKINTNQQLQQSFDSDISHFLIYFRSSLNFLNKTDTKEKIKGESQKSCNDNKNEKDEMINDKIKNTLDFKKHWNENWKISNIEAVRLVGQMIDKNEQGLIVVASNTFQWQSQYLRLYRFLDSFSFIALINRDGIVKISYGEYCVYLIASNTVILDEGITIDGNMYAIDCEIQCKGTATITTQLFVTKNTIVDKKLTQSISPIQWNTRINHDILIQLQDLAHKSEEFLKREDFAKSIDYSGQALQLAIDTFGHIHPYVADLYNNLAYVYRSGTKYDKAMECCEQTLKITLRIYGAKHAWVANMYHTLGFIFRRKHQYTNSITCHKTALKIWAGIFGNSSRYVGDSYWNLGLVFTIRNDKQSACKYYTEAWKVYSVVWGEWDRRTVETKENILQLNDELFTNT